MTSIEERDKVTLHNSNTKFRLKDIRIYGREYLALLPFESLIFFYIFIDDIKNEMALNGDCLRSLSILQ